MNRQQAFTLIELIVVVVLLGIMASGAGLLISKPIEAYSDQLRRQQLVDSAEMSLRKITTDIRRALPNSIRITSAAPVSWALELVNTVDGARYRDEAGGDFLQPDQILDFTVADKAFNLLGRFSNVPTGTLSGLRLVIYNTSASIYNDAAANSNNGIISATGDVTLTGDDGGNAKPEDDEQRVTLAQEHQFSFQSPEQRVFLVDGPVSYICDTTTRQLYRYTGYAFQAAHASTDSVLKLSKLVGAVGGTVATQVSSCSIDYQPGTAQRGGLITLGISISDAQGETVSLLQQVHVDNLP
jgi:MSHA biogenesis protein MshO